MIQREMKIASSQREVRVIVAQNQRAAYKLASQEYILGCTRDQPMPGPFAAPPIFLREKPWGRGWSYRRFELPGVDCMYLVPDY